MHKDVKEKTNFWLSDYIIIYIENSNKCTILELKKMLQKESYVKNQYKNIDLFSHSQ